jgi:tRNA/rRNA methyltransferase
VLAVATSSRQRELRHELIDAREVANVVLASAATHPVALVFGNETSGLSNEEAGLCNLMAYVPTNPAYASLNLASAVQIFAYELRMAAIKGEAGQAAEFVPATNEQVEHLYRHFEETMIATGFLDPANPKRLMPRLRRLLARARMEEDEVNILRGFLTTFKRPRG